MTRRFLKLLVACAVCLAVPLGPAVASEAIKLRVPVKLKKMVADGFHVTCRIFADNFLLGVKESEKQNVVNGQFDQIVEVVVIPLAGKTFAGANSYSCEILVFSAVSGGHPRKGTPPVPDTPVWLLAKPDEFFRSEFTGPLDGGGEVVEGIVGPKDLAVQPKPKGE